MQKTQTVCLVMLTTIAVGFSMFYLRSVLLPFVIAMFVVIGCRPVLEYVQTRLQLNRYMAFAIAFAMGTAMLIGFALMIWLSINDLARNSAAYETKLNNIAVWVAKTFLEPAETESGESKSSEAEPDQAEPDQAEPDQNEPNLTGSSETQTGQAESDPTATSGTESGETEAVETTTDTRLGLANNLETAAEETKKAIAELFAWASAYLQGQLLQLAASLSTLLSYGVLILIFVFFLLLGPDNVQEKQPTIVGEIEDQVRRYLVMKTAISALTGFAFGLVLWLFGVPLAILFGFLAFLLNFIPNIGPLVSIVLPLPLLILNNEIAPSSAIICFLLISSIQFISGNVVETKIMGKSFDVSPVVLLLGLMFFGLVWGIIGMFLATPIVSIAKIILQQHDSTRPLSELMAGRWISSDNPV